MFNFPWFFAEEIKVNGRLAMPAAFDAPRLWISEADIAAVAARILSEDVSRHVGKEYLLTGTRRFTFAQVSELVGEVLGRKIAYVDDDTYIRNVMGENYGKLKTYFSHETRDYLNVPSTDTVARLIGRPPVELREYVCALKDQLM